VASLALIVSFILLFVFLIGPIAYIASRLNFPRFFIYILSWFSILSGMWFCFIGLPIWYVGLIPIYFGWISLLRIKKKQTQA
jgi:hypothetical protein